MYKECKKLKIKTNHQIEKWSTDLNRFFNRGISIDWETLKEMFNNLVTRKIQIITTLSVHLKPVRIVKNNNTNVMTAHNGKNVEQGEHPSSASKSAVFVQQFCKSIWSFLRKLHN